MILVYFTHLTFNVHQNQLPSFEQHDFWRCQPCVCLLINHHLLKWNKIAMILYIMEVAPVFLTCACVFTLLWCMSSWQVKPLQNVSQKWCMAPNCMTPRRLNPLNCSKRKDISQNWMCHIHDLLHYVPLGINVRLKCYCGVILWHKWYGLNMKQIMYL